MIYTLSQWALTLTPSDLPERFSLYPWATVTNPELYLGNLQRQIKSGNSPRDRYGAIEKDLLALQKVLAGVKPNGKR